MASTPQSSTSSEELSRTRSSPREELAKGDQGLVDEALDETFPASDPPSWTGTHAGPPQSRPVPTETPRELRARLRNVIDRLPKDRSRAADYIASAFLDSGHLVVRIPSSHHPEVETIEAVVRGYEDGEELVIAARYDDNPAAVSVLLGLARVLEGRRLARKVRLVAYAGGESADYADRLVGHAIQLCGVLCLDSVGFLAERAVPRTLLSRLMRRVVPSWSGTFVAFVGDYDTKRLLEATREAFTQGTSLAARTLRLPALLPLLASRDSRAFAARGFPAVTVTDTEPLRNAAQRAGERLASSLDYDAMADVVFGLSSVAAKVAASPST